MEIDAGSEAPKKVNALIEIPKGSNIKYEYDEKLGAIRVDRILHTAMFFPYNYGFVAGTLGEDGDPLDILVVSSAAFFPNTVVVARPIGMVRMKDEEGVDNKIVAVPLPKVDPEYANVNDIEDLSQHTRDMIVHFLSYYKALEPGKWVKLDGWDDVKKAQQCINDAISRRKKK
ncbi:MAG: inorganic diphosphatase [Candidatus Micrarchaeota archaeon]|nr:inorganic diphosphatase [Candidatus Micrarchaeota archaeon]